MKKIKFNLIDAVIIAGVAVVLIIFGYFAFGNSSSAGADSKTIDYTVEISDVPAEYLNKINTGDMVLEVKKGENIGTVVEVGEAKKFAEAQENKKLGTFVKTEYPDSYVYTVKIRTPYEETDTGYSVNGTELKVGKLITIKTKGLATDALVIKMEKGDEGSAD